METIPTIPVINADKVMDVRPIPCSIKHGLILKTWQDLAVGDYFILLNDHDPVPLRYQFSAEFPGAFTWEHLQKGPEEFRVKITKLSPVAKTTLASCCGGKQSQRADFENSPAKPENLLSASEAKSMEFRL